jgi:hypothetical protein
MGRVFKIVIKVHTLKGTASQTEKKSFIPWDSFINMIYRTGSKKGRKKSLNLALVVSNFGQV